MTCCTYILFSDPVCSPTAFSASSAPCVPKAFSSLRSVAQISSPPFGALHSTWVVSVLPRSIITPLSLQVYKNLMNSLQCFGLLSFSLS